MNNGFPGTRILQYCVSKNVTVRGVKYSEFNGDYTYYLDIDGYEIPEDESFNVTVFSEPSEEGLYLQPNFGPKYVGDYVPLSVTDKGTLATLSWHSQLPEYSYLSVVQHNQFNRFFVNLISVEDPKPEEIIVEPQKEGLYVGEYTDRTVVKCKYSDGITRFERNYELNRESFDQAGKQTLTATCKGLTGSVQVDVKEVPSYMAILNQKGKYGRLRSVTVKNEDGDPITDAVITVSDPVRNENFNDDDYDNYGQNKDHILRLSREIQVRLPMSTPADANVFFDFETLKDEYFAYELFLGENVETITNDDETKDKEAIRQAAANRADTQKLIEIRQGKLSQAIQLLEQELSRPVDWRWLYASIVTILLSLAIVIIYKITAYVGIPCS